METINLMLPTARLGLLFRWIRRASIVAALALLCLVQLPASVGLTPLASPEGSLEGEPDFQVPIDGETLRAFDPPQRDWMKGHRGVDLGGDLGQPVRAAGNGKVVYAATLVDRGVVSIDHPQGVRTTYEPISPVVRRGQNVKRGQIIGHLDRGSSHCLQPCLHWGARTGPKEYIDPLALVNPPMIRLYPPEPW